MAETPSDKPPPVRSLTAKERKAFVKKLKGCGRLVVFVAVVCAGKTSVFSSLTDVEVGTYAVEEQPGTTQNPNMYEISPGIAVIDPPGLFAPENNKEASRLTFQLVALAHVVVVVSAGSWDENTDKLLEPLAHLPRLKEDPSRLVIALNKTDTLKAHARNHRLSCTREQMEKFPELSGCRFFEVCASRYDPHLLEDEKKTAKDRDKAFEENTAQLRQYIIDKAEEQPPDKGMMKAVLSAILPGGAASLATMTAGAGAYALGFLGPMLVVVPMAGAVTLVPLLVIGTGAVAGVVAGGAGLGTYKLIQKHKSKRASQQPNEAHLLNK